VGGGREGRRGLPTGGADDAGLARQSRGGDQGRGSLPGRGPSKDKGSCRVLETILSVRLGFGSSCVVTCCVIVCVPRCICLPAFCALAGGTVQAVL